MTIAVAGDRVTDAGFEARGCGASSAAASAAVGLIRGASITEAARIGTAEVAQELGGLSPGKLHAAELAADALARALGGAVRAHAQHSAQSFPAGHAGGHERRSRQRGRRAPVRAGGTDPGGDARAVGRCRERRRDAAAARPRRSPKPAHWPTRWGSRTSPSTCARSSAPASWTRSSPATPRGRRPTRAWAATATSGWTRCWTLADRLGCGALATGHYARTAEPDDARGPLLRVATDTAKDQTYMLAALKPDSLARMRFPLGELRKPEVRRIAAEAGLPVAAKVDSQDLCFLAGTEPRPVHGAPRGDPERARGDRGRHGGTVLGRHDGQHRFTVGQRRGLGIASAEPLFVLAQGRAHRTRHRRRPRGTAHRPRRHPCRTPAPRRTPC